MHVLRLERQGFLGPFLLLFALIVSLIDPSSRIALPLVAVLGLPLCLRYQMRGLVVSLGLLFLTLLIFYHDLPHGDRLWAIGLGSAFALALTVATLQREDQAAEEEKAVQKERERLEFERMVGLLSADKERLSSELSAAAQEVKGLEERAAAEQERLRDEIVRARSELGTAERQQSFERERWQGRENQLREQIEELVAERDAEQQELNTARTAFHQKELDAQARLAALQQKLDLIETVHEEQREELLVARQSLAQKDQELESRASECTLLEVKQQEMEHQLVDLQDRLKSNVEEREALRSEMEHQLAELQSRLTAKTDECEALRLEKGGSREAEAQLKQLREQFDQKGAVLGETRVKLWELESKLLQLQRRQQEEKRSPKKREEQLLAELAALDEERGQLVVELSEMEAVVARLLGELASRSIPVGIMNYE